MSTIALVSTEIPAAGLTDQKIPTSTTRRTMTIEFHNGSVKDFGCMIGKMQKGATTVASSVAEILGVPDLTDQRNQDA